MTACKDSLNGKKAVSATLAGVLAVGMVPAAAFAAEAPADEAQNDGIELLTGEASQDFANGHITQTNNDITWNVTDKQWEATAKSSAQKLVVTQVATQSGQTVAINDNYTVKYYAADSEGEITATEVSNPTEVGTYYVTVTGKDKAEAYAGASLTEKFVIKANDQAFDSMKAGAPSKDGKTVNTTAGFTYTAEEQEVGFTLGSASEAANALEAGKDYEVTWYKAKGNLDASTQLSGSPVDAGDYIASVKGLGQYAGVTKNIKVTVNPLDLNDNTVAYAGITTTSASAPTALEGMTVGGKDASDALVSQLKLTFNDSTKDYYGENGTYTFAVEPVDSNNKNFVGAGATFNAGDKGSVTVTKVGKLATFKYGKKALAESYDLDKSAEDYAAFNPANIKAYNGTTEITAGVTKTYYHKDNEGKWVSDGQIAPDFTKAGSYKVVTTVLTNDSKVGGSAETVVNVTEGAVDADASVYVIYDDVATTSVTVPYATAGVQKTAFTAKGTAKDADTGNDITLSTDKSGKAKLILTFYDADGEKVKGDKIVNAGEYTVEVTSDSYQLEGTTSISLTIAPIDLGAVKLPTSEKGDFVAKGTTVAGLEANIKYNTGKEAEKVDAEQDGKGWDKISGSGFASDIAYTVEKLNDEGEWVDATGTMDEGDYRVTVKAADKKKAANFEFAEDGQTVVEFKVADENKVVFTDVTPNDWFFDTVYAAHHAEYIFGVGNSNQFAPNTAITRADVCVILGRMAGVPTDPSKEGYESFLGGYTTPFSDVDSAQYYAKAIAWAAKAGIVTGYGDTGEFKPEQAITREEFATMLARYAEKVKGADISADADALDGYADEANVSDWAKGYVAWAVEAKAMGQNTDMLWAGKDITRAEAATMAVRYQPGM